MPPKVSLTEPPFTYKWTRAQLGRAADNEAAASLAEAVNPKVDGSSPSGGAITQTDDTSTFFSGNIRVRFAERDIQSRPL